MLIGVVFSKWPVTFPWPQRWDSDTRLGRMGFQFHPLGVIFSRFVRWCLCVVALGLVQWGGTLKVLRIEMHCIELSQLCDFSNPII